MGKQLCEKREAIFNEGAFGGVGLPVKDIREKGKTRTTERSFVAQGEGTELTEEECQVSFSSSRASPVFRKWKCHVLGGGVLWRLIYLVLNPTSIVINFEQLPNFPESWLCHS